jgi:predicted dehydrogenase
VTGDLLAHSIDTAIWLIGGIDSVSAMTETFIKEREHQETGKKQAVTIDDACAFLARFNNGALSTFESTRYARGRKNYNTFEVNGADGSIAFNLEEPHRLQYFDNRHDAHVHGWQDILVTDFEHPYMDKYWVPGTTIGYEHTFINALSDFLKSLEDGQDPVRPSFRDALETQRVCDAVLKSAKTGVWEKAGE